MVNVSKIKVDEKVLSAISDNLIKHISELRTVADVEKFLLEMLSPAERIMLAKRFAIIFMLERECSYGRIIKALKVSPATVSWIENDRADGAFNFIIGRIARRNGGKRHKTENFNFWDGLDELLRVGGIMPPMGRGRWRRFYKNTE